MRRSSIVALSVCLLLLSVPLASGAFGGAPIAQQESNESELTIDELKDGGPRLDNAPPSVRMGDEMSFWLVHWPADNLFAEPGASDSGEYLPEDATLNRNTVYIRTWQYSDLSKRVHVVSWNKGTRTVERGNSTVEEPVARNVSHVVHDVTFERGRPTVPIELGTHDEPTQITMWIEGLDWARWTFTHKSIATTQSVGISSAGDYLKSVILDFLLWIVVGGFLVGLLSKRAIDRAGIGPQYGYGPWIIGLSVVTGLGTLLAYESVADLVVNSKYVISLYIVGIIGIIMLETYHQNVTRSLFIRPTLEYAESPTGEDGFDMVDLDGEEHKVIRTPDGEVAIVKPGLLAFLARVFGSSARLENVEKLRTRTPFTEGSKWDELFIADPESEELVHYAPEGWELDYPELSRETAPTYLLVLAGVSLAGYAITSGIGSSLLVGAVTVAGLAVWGLSPVDGVAGVDPAPVHIRSAFATMLQLNEDVDNAKRLDEVKTQLDNERISKQRDIDEEVRRHDKTLVEEMLDPDESVPASVEVEDFTDEEVTQNGRDSGREGARPDGGREDE